MRQFVYRCESCDATAQLGRALSKVAVAGLVVGLRGVLGSGKTFFVRAVAEGLNVPDSRAVTSPTFILIHEYSGRLPVYHFDTYRLQSHDDFAELGVEEYFSADGICLVEWADRVEHLLPEERLDVELTITGSTSRAVGAACLGERYAELFEHWRAAVSQGSGPVTGDVTGESPPY